MTPEEWPIWIPPERGGIAPAPRAGRDRLPTVRSDFFLDETFRLTEQERALMTAMLHRLVGDVAAEIQSTIPEDWLPANEDNDGLIRRISSAKLLDIEGLMALLLRRADEERLSVACQARSAQPGRSLTQSLVSDSDAEVAGAAMSVLIGRGRRRDRFGRPMLELDDVEPEDALQLVFAVAAGLRERLPVTVPPSEAETVLGQSAQACLARQDRSKSLEFLLTRLAVSLAAAGKLEEGTLLAALDSADVSLLSHAISARGRIAPDTAFNELMSGDARRVMTLLLLADISRGFAAKLLGTLGDLIGLPADAQNLAAYDGVDSEQRAMAGSWLRLDPKFRTSLQHLGHGYGNRSV